MHHIKRLYRNNFKSQYELITKGSHIDHPKLAIRDCNLASLLFNRFQKFFPSEMLRKRENLIFYFGLISNCQHLVPAAYQMEVAFLNCSANNSGVGMASSRIATRPVDNQDSWYRQYSIQGIERSIPSYLRFTIICEDDSHQL